ncbi:MAG: TonB-dependent receptor [Saprospiraceae bacterium]|nr:TonB-dependent receptor [Saprospiraceae bacterium]
MLHLFKSGVLAGTMLFSLSLRGQDCTLRVRGVVEDIHHHAGLEYATVYVEETGQGSICTETGEFSIENLCKGSYHFLVSHLGCQSQRHFISINRDTIIHFHLEHHATMLSEVLVSENRSKTGIGLQHYSIGGAGLQALAGKDLSQIAAQIPGVSVLKSGVGLSKPVINGLYGHRIQILNQGVPQEGQQWGLDHAPEIDPLTFQKISVVKGSAAVKYGVNAMAGVLILESQSIRNDPHVHGHVQAMYLSNGRGLMTNLQFSQALPALRYRFNGTFKVSGDQHTPDYYLTNTAAGQQSFALQLTNDPGKKYYRSLYLSSFSNQTGLLLGSHVGNLTDLEAALQSKEPLYTRKEFSYGIEAPRQQVNHLLIKFENRVNGSHGKTWGGDVAVQKNSRKEFDVRRGGRDSIPSLGLHLWNIWADVFLTKENDKSKFSLGLQPRFGHNKNEAGTGVYPLIPNYTQLNHAAYASWIQKWGNVSAELGSRYEYQLLKVSRYTRDGQLQKPEHRFQNAALNAGAEYQPNDKFSVKTNVAFIHRSPQVHELYSDGLHQGLAAIEEGNAMLGAEQSWKVSADLRYHLGQENQIALSVYYHNIDKFIFLAPTGTNRLTVRGAFPVFRYFQEGVNLKGLDLLVHQGIGHHLEINVKAAYVHGSYREDGSGLIYMPPFQSSAEVSTLFSKWWVWEDIKLTLDASYTAKARMNTRPMDLVAPPKEYTLFGLSWSGKQTVAKKQFVYTLKGENIFNVKYRDYLNRLRYFADDPGRNITFRIQFIF